MGTSLTRLLGVVMVLLAGVACGNEGKAVPSTGSPRPYDRMYQGLCLAHSRVARPTDARQAFFDLAHQPIHELAATAALSDRAAAGRLLEAKQAVEAALAGDAARLAPDLDRLLAATSRAIVATGQPAPKPCKETP